MKNPLGYIVSNHVYLCGAWVFTELDIEYTEWNLSSQMLLFDHALNLALSGKGWLRVATFK